MIFLNVYILVSQTCSLSLSACANKLASESAESERKRGNICLPPSLCIYSIITVTFSISVILIFDPNVDSHVTSAYNTDNVNVLKVMGITANN